VSINRYQWKRFWCPREGRYHLSGEGYLTDPESGGAFSPNNHLVTLDDVLDTPCLVLLGEPGIGKSTAMRDAVQAIRFSPRTRGDLLEVFDLRDYGSDERLSREIFGGETFAAWKSGSHNLHLFLDSLDEALLRIDTIPPLLAKELQRVPRERLRLRIACRTVDWPNTLEDSLKSLWQAKRSEESGSEARDGEGIVKVLELVPLRRRDVESAIDASNLDTQQVMQEIRQKDAVPFAIKPITLRFLINIFRKSGQIPQTKAELYRLGCLALCEENNEQRLEAHRTGNLDSEQRLAVAGRIAAVMVFCNRYAVSKGINRGDVPEEDATLAQLTGCEESAKGSRFNVRESEIRETLNTGLFNSRGPNRMGWAHQTYAEFLAARYLVDHDMSVEQILSLVVHPEDSSGKLVPQLQEVVVWLVNLRPEMFADILHRQPELLLATDVGLADDTQRALLLDEILARTRSRSICPPDLGTILRATAIMYPGIENHLRRYLSDSREDLYVRRLAIEFTVSGKVDGLSKQLVEIALCTTEEYSLRGHAAWAVSEIGNRDARASLKTLATMPGDDPDDQLKGYALCAIWPDHISSGELFDVLSEPKRETFYGGYERFLRHELLKHMKPDQLPDALSWVQQH
jgi:predicted NACHT family NTPase